MLSDPVGNFEKRLDFWVSASRVGHFLLSDPAGNLKSVLTSGCLPFAWVTSCSQTLQVILKSVLTSGCMPLAWVTSSSQTLQVILKSVLTSGCLLFALSSTSLHDGPLEEVKIKTVWSQDLGMFWSQDLELVELG